MKTDPPKHLSREAVAVWRRLQAEFGIDDAAGLVLLQSALEGFDRIAQAREILARDGLTVEVDGKLRPHPALAIERDAANRMHSALRLMRLAPEALQ
jgi:P27 family predicted phage terminase small subunit